jgi:hypothetical protein
MQRAVSAWIGDLFWQRPAVRKGKAYWSISPAFGQAEKTTGGLKIGFADDTEYLGRLERIGIRRVLAVCSEVAKLRSTESFQGETLLQLLEANDLSLFSVWSPTFLTTLMEKLFDSMDVLLPELRTRNPKRAIELDTIFGSKQSNEAKLQRVWPALAIISCWADGTAADYLGHLQAFFPKVEVQPKGLLSTEAFVSFPLVGRVGSAVAIRSHFLEFSAIEDPENIFLSHQLIKGTQYNPIVTTGGGLYRYQTSDIVEVVGFENECPLIRFVGRSGSSDLVGEKLDEAFVRAAIRFAVQPGSGDQPIAMLIPDAGPPASYTLLIETGGAGEFSGEEFSREEIAQRIDSCLSRNPHYAYARRIGQLDEPRVALLDRARGSLWSKYETACVASAIRMGDIKPTVLCCHALVGAKILTKVGQDLS